MRYNMNSKEDCIMANPYYEPETDPDLEALLRAADAVLDDRPEEENDPFDIQLPPEVYGEELPPKPAPGTGLPCPVL